MGISIRLGYPEQWHNFAAGDVPADGELCFAVFETEGNKLSWIYGAYKAAQNEFYCDNGMGGEVLNGAFCRAWVPSSEIRVKERKDEAAQSAAAAQKAKAVEGAENPAAGAGAPQAGAKAVHQGIWQKMLQEFSERPRDVHTVPKTKVKPKWFYVYVEDGKVCLDAAREHDNSISTKSGRPKLKKSEAEPMLRLHHRRERGEAVSEEAARVSFAQAYWYGIYSEMGV